MKKKILFAIESLAGGGAEKILTNIVKNLDKNKYDVTVLTIVRTGVYVAEMENHCRLISFLPDYNSLKSVIEKIDYKRRYKEIYTKPVEFIYKKYIKEQFDVEIAFVEGFVTKLIAASSNEKSRKYAWVHTDMVSNPHADQNYKNLQEHKNTYKQYNTIFAVSENVKNAFYKKFDLEYSVKIQYNPIDSNEILRKAMENSITRNDNKIVFITIGRLTKVKAYDRLLRIINELKNKYNVTLWILGDGEQKSELEEYIKKNGLMDCIKLFGFQNNPYSFLKAADIFICSSISEGFSTVATEALILHKPIITTDCAGMKELFGSELCGIITENNEQSLYEGMKAVLDNRKKIDIYKDAVKKRAKQFDIRIRMKEIEAILDD